VSAPIQSGTTGPLAGQFYICDNKYQTYGDGWFVASFCDSSLAFCSGGS
jgi:hypothetical protein